MPSISSGRIVKSRRKVRMTPHQRNHRWESFTTKISKLHSLDPLRKVRRHDLENEDLSSTTSYLRTGVGKWADLNISKSFTNFKREILPRCESLPQILHFEEEIMGLLVSYISLQEKESLEPLLDLLTAFAHDLGVRFEKHYAKSLELVIAIASRPQDADVIEWTFAALAFLFKYLARLLVPNLTPTYMAMSPLLGKARQPQYIARFAAEALSFLVKKAAAPSHRETSLPALITCVRDDLRSVVGQKQFELYYHGVMTMFAEAIKGSGNSLHSTGPEIFTALLHAIPGDEFEPGRPTTWSDVCCGVLTSAIHHSTVETFGNLADAVVAEAAQAPAANETKANPWRLSIYTRMFGILAGVRSGNRLSNWKPLVGALSSLLHTLSKGSEQVLRLDSSLIWESVVLNVAIVWAQAPVDSIISSITTLTDTMTREPFMKWFISFCSYFANLNAERFRGLLQTHFQRFIVAHWSDDNNEEKLCVLLPQMVGSGVLPPSGSKESLPLPQSWQDQVVSKFERLEITPFPERGAYDKDPKTWRDKCLPKYSALLRVLESTAIHPSTSARIAELLLRKLKLALRPSPSVATDETHFIVSTGFHAYLRMSKEAGTLDLSLKPLLRAAAPRFCRLIGFLQSLLAYEQELARVGHQESQSSSGSESPQAEEDRFVKSLVSNLSTNSHELRLVSLCILSLSDLPGDRSSTLSALVQIEETPLDLANARTMSVYLRKLGKTYGGLEVDSWLRKAIPAFLFGMLTVRLSPVWDDAIEALKEIAITKAAEDIVASLAFEWLEVPSTRWTGPPKSTPDSAGRRATDFECTNLARLQETSREIKRIDDDVFETMLRAFEESQKTVPEVPDAARGKALKVLLACPSLAERRSRRLVPHLFRWNDVVSDEHDDRSDDQPGGLADTTWSLADRKALLGVFALFTNSKVLYQHEKVYSVMLNLVANGDVEIQRLALKSILSWKQDAVKRYHENMEALLEDTRLRNELTLLFQGDKKIRDEDRSELMPVLLRLLYGRTISKKGAASGRHGVQATRNAVIRSLQVDDLGRFLEIALGPLQGLQILDNVGLRASLFERELIPARKQVGLLNMLDTIIIELGTNILPFMGSFVNAVLYCLVSASRRLNGGTDEAEDGEEEGEKNEASLVKVARTTALKCLCMLLRNATSFDWTPYQQAIVSEAVSPRIEKLGSETTQGVSWTWRLLETWSLLPRCAMVLSLDASIMPAIVQSLGISKGKDDVKIFALGIVRNLVRLAQAPATESEFNELIRADILDSNMDGILGEIGGLLKDNNEMGRPLLEASVETVVELVPLIESSKNVRELLEISTFLLNQPTRKVNPKVKGSILLILERFIVLEDLQADAALKKNIYDTISSLFGFFKDRENRQSLSRLLLVFASQERNVQEVAGLCSDMNSYVEGKIDQPDYDRRLAAFTSISSTRDVSFTVDQWSPLLHNLIYYIRHDEEFGILSSNSADGICKFIEVAESAWTGSSQQAFADRLSATVLPAIYSGAHERSETVRREYLRVLGFLASHLPSWPLVSDLAPLIPECDDSDQAFFFNIVSPAVSRQFQSLQILQGVNERSELGSRNVSQFFIPLLEHLIFDREEGSDDHGLGAQATNTIANLASSLEWSQYRALLRRFISFVESKPQLQKQVVRLLDKTADTLNLAASRSFRKMIGLDPTSEALVKTSRLAKTLPDRAKLGEEISAALLSPLLDHLHQKDEATVSARVPVGVIIVKLLNLLPEAARDQKLPGVLTDICHILRSKAPESRDMARETLVKISVILGPSCFGFVLKELRGALTRGSQLHVLSYTMHSILVAVIPEFKQGDLDYCLSQIASVIMDDIFGVTGLEKDAEEYTSKMKEVKSSKSQDSMELIAKNTSINRLVDLTQPLKDLLLEKLNIRMARKIDELLSRITAGLLQNPAAESRDALVFCYEVIQDVYNSRKAEAQPKLDPKLKRYLIQKGAKKSNRGTTTKHTYKLIRFALDVLRSLMRKHESLRTASNVTGFIRIIGDAVIAGEEEVKVAAFKLLVVLVKVQFKNNDSTSLYKVALKEALRAISSSPSTTTDLAQTALKLVSVILRDRRDIPIKDAAVDMLLGKLKDDLTEPLYRHVSFNFLRSVLDRKVETALVYDTLDHVGTVMIANDDKNTRDLARGAFFQFLREYPQKRSRWEKQLKFIVANLQYDREGGRLSVMEVIHLLLMKSADDFVQEVSTTCFIPLVFVLANDDSENCRLAAGALMKEIFRGADRTSTQKFLTILKGMLGQDENAAVLRLAILAFGFYFEVREVSSSKDKKDLELLMDKIMEVLTNFFEDPDLVNIALQVVQGIFDKDRSLVLSRGSEKLWAKTTEYLSHPDTTVKLTAVKLLSSYLADFARNAGTAAALKSKSGVLQGSHGLELSKRNRMRFVQLGLSIFTSDEVSEALAEEAARVLIFLGNNIDFETEEDAAFDDEAEDAEEQQREDGEETDDTEDNESPSRTDSRQLFTRLSAIIRKETRPRSAELIPKLAAADVLSSFCARAPAESLTRSLGTILRPLRNITDPSIPTPWSQDPDFKEKHDSLRTKAQAVMDALQKKLGSGAYARGLLAVGEGVKKSREARSSKRKIEAVAAPERSGAEKRKRFEKKRERRKVRGQEHRALRRGV